MTVAEVMSEQSIKAQLDLYRELGEALLDLVREARLSDVEHLLYSYEHVASFVRMGNAREITKFVERFGGLKEFPGAEIAIRRLQHAEAALDKAADEELPRNLSAAKALRSALKGAARRTGIRLEEASRGMPQ